MRLGANAIAPLIHGASAISGHIICNADSIDQIAGEPSIYNSIFRINIGTTLLGILVRLVDSVLVSDRFQIRARSQTSDAIQTVSGTSGGNGTLYRVGWVVDVAGDAMRLYLNGVLDVNTAVTFGAATFTNAGTQTLQDQVGGGSITTTQEMWDGLLAEMAIWNVDIGDAGFSAVGAGHMSPLLVRPEALVFYLPMIGKFSPEGDVINSKLGTITGSLPALRHPRVFTPRGRRR